MKKVIVLMGSESDLETMKKALGILERFGVEAEVHIASAHRTPDKVRTIVQGAEANNTGVIIAAAGMAAHLAGAVAANTTLPVIGVPLSGGKPDGLDALLSTVQMPKGMPVATVAINGSENAALLACQILATEDKVLAQKLKEYRIEMRAAAEEADLRLQAGLGKK